MTVPKEHVVDKEKVLSDLEKYKNEDYIAWIGHATYLIKLGRYNNYNRSYIFKKCRSINFWSQIDLLSLP